MSEQDVIGGLSTSTHRVGADIAQTIADEVSKISDALQLPLGKPSRPARYPDPTYPVLWEGSLICFGFEACYQLKVVSAVCIILSPSGLQKVQHHIRIGPLRIKWT